jgi:antitoxin component YwqK of YwqJK toxin-antitoxin module
MIALALALLAAAPSAPLACPAGTEYRGGQPLEQFEEYCVELLPERTERREGPTVEYYEDGSIWKECRFHEGKLDGAYRERFRGGRIAREGAYAAGQRTGPWRFYAEDGTLLEDSSFRNGEFDGPFAAFWPSGKPRTKGLYCLGAQCGVWLSYDEQGKLQGSIEFGELRAVP